MIGATRRFLLTGVLALGLMGCAAKGPAGPNGEPTEKLSIITASGEHQFWVEIANDEPKRQRGLMFRPPLEDDRGMLFEWPGEPAREQSFWMRNTPSSLDIIYIDPQGKIVSIAAHATPFSSTNTFTLRLASQCIIAVNSSPMLGNSRQNYQ